MSVSRILLAGAFPFASALLEVLDNSSTKMQSAVTGDLQNLEIEAAKQKIMLEAAKVQAQVAQEMAIAERIQCATEVQIEEFYDSDIGGKIGVNSDGNSGISLGASADRRVVTKRIFILKGWKNDIGGENTNSTSAGDIVVEA